MAHDAEVSTNLTAAFADLKNKVGGMSGWSVAYDDYSDWGDEFALQTRTSEIVRFITDDTTDDLCEVQYGASFETDDDGNFQWTDTYHNTIGEFHFGPSSDDNVLNGGDAVTYWLTYTSTDGFVFYLDRNEGETDDGDAAFGMAELNKLWGYDSAATREGDYALLVQGGGDAGDHYFNATGEGVNNPVATNTVDAWGIINPDANYTDYVALETNFVASWRYERDNEQAIIGTHDLWLHDRSEGASAHKETIDDGSGSDKWVILDAHSRSNNPDNADPIAIRTDL